jgi:uncharacterized protein YegL
MPESEFTTENTRGFKREELEMLNTALSMLIEELGAEFAVPRDRARVAITTWYPGMA